MNESIKKLESSIEIAKKVLQENPEDTWVAKGLVLMEHELEKLKNSPDDRRTEIR